MNKRRKAKDEHKENEVFHYNQTDIEYEKMTGPNVRWH